MSRLSLIIRKINLIFSPNRWFSTQNDVLIFWVLDNGFNSTIWTNRIAIAANIAFGVVEVPTLYYRAGLLASKENHVYSAGWLMWPVEITAPALKIRPVSIPLRCRWHNCSFPSPKRYLQIRPRRDCSNAHSSQWKAWK